MRFAAGLMGVLKGGPGSGNWSHAGRPGKTGGSLPGGGLPLSAAERKAFAGEKTSAGRLSQFVTPRNRLTPEYERLKPAQKEEVLKAALRQHKNAYTKVADLPPGIPDQHKKVNAALGGIEAIRNRALASLGKTDDPTEKRKIMHGIVKLQEEHGRLVGIRQDLMARGVEGPEVPPAIPLKSFRKYVTPEGTIRTAAYKTATPSVKADVLQTAAARYERKYMKVADLPEGASERARLANRAVGAMEAVRSVALSKLSLTEGDETAERKLLHGVFDLQRESRRMARIRDLSLRRPA